MSRRVSPAFSTTSNAAYGKFSIHDNDEWRKTYLNRLPKVKKNKNMSRQQQSLITGNEEYGRFFSPSRTIATNVENGVNEQDSSAQEHNDGQQVHARTVPVHMRRQRPEQTKASRVPHRGHAPPESLPPINRTGRTSTNMAKQGGPKARFGNTSRFSNTGSSEMQISGELPSGTGIPDIKRIDISLFTRDGNVITISALPVTVQSKRG